MSKRRPGEEYKKTRAYRFFQWLNGEKDPYLGNVEMKPQKEHVEAEATIQERTRERQMLFDKVYHIEENKELRLFNSLYRIMSVVFCVIIIAVLVVAVSYLPPIGDASNPGNNEVTERYIESGLEETGAVNIVTGMILDYRAFDTFGESNVLFIATITVLILLRLDKKKDNETGADAQAIADANDRIYEPKNDAILQKVAFVLVPMLLIFGIYIVLNGHLSPGGGFSGGAIMGAGLILYLNAFGFSKTEKFFTEKTYKWICFGALSFYCIAKSYSFFTGANQIHSIIPMGTPGNILSSGLILPLNICVGLVVACTMYAFYALFRKGGF